MTTSTLNIFFVDVIISFVTASYCSRENGFNASANTVDNIKHGAHNKNWAIDFNSGGRM